MYPLYVFMYMYLSMYVERQAVIGMMQEMGRTMQNMAIGMLEDGSSMGNKPKAIGYQDSGPTITEVDDSSDSDDY